MVDAVCTTLKLVAMTKYCFVSQIAKINTVKGNLFAISIQLFQKLTKISRSIN